MKTVINFAFALSLFLLNFTFANELTINNSNFEKVLKNNEKVNTFHSSQTDAVLRNYARKIQNKAKANWKPLANYRENFVVVARIALDKNGNLINSKIVTPSPYKQEDEAILKLIKNASPYEKIPEQYEKETIVIELTYEYRIIQNPARWNI